MMSDDDPNIILDNLAKSTCLIMINDFVEFSIELELCTMVESLFEN